MGEWIPNMEPPGKMSNAAAESESQQRLELIKQKEAQLLEASAKRVDDAAAKYARACEDEVAAHRNYYQELAKSHLERLLSKPVDGAGSITPLSEGGLQAINDQKEIK